MSRARRHNQPHLLQMTSPHVTHIHTFIPCLMPSPGRVFFMDGQRSRAAEGGQAQDAGPSTPSYTPADLAFLQAAREVAALHRDHIDPTIRDILNRLEYGRAPHGGFPVARRLDSQAVGPEAPTASVGTLGSLGALSQLQPTNQYSDTFPELSMDIFKQHETYLGTEKAEMGPNSHSTGDLPLTGQPRVAYAELPRTHECQVCHLAFKRSSDLKRHEKIHLDVPPNVCPLCTKRFARKDALKRHVDTLTCRRNRERLLH